MPKKLAYIVFAVKHAKKAESFGFTRNQCCRNLKLALEHFWRKKTKGLSQKKNINRSVAAEGKELSELQVEHIVPKTWFVDQLMDMKVKDLTQKNVKNLLEKYYHVLLVTKDEHSKLGALGLRSKMPNKWDEKNIWARYDDVGIEVSDNVRLSVEKN